MYNTINSVDSYKISHHKQYPPGTTSISSYFESRGGKFPFVKFFGMQGILKRYFLEPLQHGEALYWLKRFNHHIGLDNKEGWDIIRHEHNGLLPLRIEAVPEGICVPPKNVLFQVQGNDPRLPWLSSWVETLLEQLWYPSTVCTLSQVIKDILLEYLEETCENPQEVVRFMLHDFGCRGASSMETAGIGGASHLVNFLGTDTVPALDYLEMFYDEPMAGFSIPAMEHSTVTTWGRAGEVDAFRNMLREFGGSGKVLAMVVDSYDMDNAVQNIICDELKDEIVNSGTRVVVRPDSGNPIFTVPRILKYLDAAFGGTNNHKGYRVLSPSVRIIQGDGMSLESIKDVCEVVKANGFSVENIAFGLGGGLLQKVNRDDMKFAYKSSEMIQNDFKYDVFKDPKTDPGKVSKKGRLALEADPITMQVKTVREGEIGEGKVNLLRPVYENGELLVDETLETIRGREHQRYSQDLTF